jgi:hypothetical protein
MKCASVLDSARPWHCLGDRFSIVNSPIRLRTEYWNSVPDLSVKRDIHSGTLISGFGVGKIYA